MSKTIVKDIPTESIIVGERFRVEHGSITDLAKSITEFGILQPLVVDTDLRLVAGGRRLAAATLLGLASVPCVLRADAKKDLTLRKMELHENIKRKAFTWQEEVALVAEIHRIENGDAAKAGEKWTLDKTAALLDRDRSGVSKDMLLAQAIKAHPELASCENKSDAAQVLKDLSLAKAATLAKARGEEALLKETKKVLVTEKKAEDKAGPVAPDMDHFCKLVNFPQSVVRGIAADRMKTGDCRAGMAELEAGSFPIIHCDPPYGVDIGATKTDVKSTAISFDDSPEWYYENLPWIASETYRLAAENAWMIFWFGYKNDHYTLSVKELRDAGWNVNPLPAVWTKPSGNSSAPSTHLASMYEGFLLCSKGKPVFGKPGLGNHFAHPHAKRKFHQTQKPVALLTDILSILATSPCRVLDPFMGSGSMAVAATLGKFRYTGFELDPEMADLARTFFMDYVIRGVTDA